MGDFFIAEGLFVCWTLFLGGPQGIGGLRGLFLPVNLRGLWGTWGDSFTAGGLFFVRLCFGENSGTQGTSGYSGDFRELKGLQGTSGDSGDSMNLRGLRAP